MSDRSQTEQAVGLFFEAINKNDATLVPLADDVVICGPMMPEPITGQAAVRQHISEIAPFIDRVVADTIVIEADRAAVIITFELLNGLSFEGARFFRVRDGLICYDQVFFDTRKLFKVSD